MNAKTRIKVSKYRMDNGLIVPNSVESFTASVGLIMGLLKILKQEIKTDENGKHFEINYRDGVYDYYQLSEI